MMCVHSESKNSISYAPASYVQLTEIFSDSPAFLLTKNKPIAISVRCSLYLFTSFRIARL